MAKLGGRYGRLALALTGALVCASSTPALASSAADYFRARATSTNVPELLSSTDREFYRALFAAIDGKDWSKVDAMLLARPDGPLHQVAKAEYYLDSASPKVELPAIEGWLAQGTHLPQSQQIANLGLKRGMVSMPGLPVEQQLVPQGYASRRTLPSAINDGTMPESVKSAILERIKADDPDGARLLLDGVDAGLSGEARAEWRQRVAWSYYIENQDAAALGMAQTVRNSGNGAWVGEGEWTAGLAAWRLGDCAGAMDAFQRTGAAAYNPELNAAGYYWASRAAVRCREPQKAAEFMRGAARLDETLYGMLAREALAQELPGAKRSADFDLADWQRLRDRPNIRAAVALSEVGRDGLADEVLRYEARTGPASEYDALSRLARELGLPSTQLWMAANAPRGAKAERALRYPAPRWQPVNGWTVDPALAFAHTLQESQFKAGAVSPAGARGLMQIMPAAAKDHSGTLGYSGSPSDLNRPEVNLAFGQRHLAMLRDSSVTGGLLPKIMAAYNAGLTPLGRWNAEIRDQGDPLLYMESIPYWETRGYVAIVMRNYWMYERQAGGSSDSRKALAQGMWPTFPELGGTGAVRLSAK